MKQPTRTLPQTVKLFPKSFVSPLVTAIPNDFYHRSYEEKLKFVGSTNETYYSSFKDDTLFFGKKITTICRCGKKFFPKHTWTDTIIIKGNKINISVLSIEGLKRFLSIINIDTRFIDDEHLNSCNIYLARPIIIADILRKKVYNRETLCKTVLSKIYHLKGFDWKLFYEYLKHDNNYYSLFDLKEFTKDLNASLRTLIDLGDRYNPIYRDLLDCAVKLNEIVDFTWSKRRIREEHQRQINTLNKRIIDAKEQVPVFNIECEEPNIRLLNTEKDVFIEGTSMHHCLYTNYWSRIKNKEYIAFHMTAPEDCTFSFKKSKNDIVFDQAFLAYDRPVSPETKQIILDFLNKTKKILEEHLIYRPNITFEPLIENQLYF